MKIPHDAKIDRAVSNMHAGPPDLVNNPAMCPECFGVGGWEDFGGCHAV